MTTNNQIPCTDLDLERRFVATKINAGNLIAGHDISPDDLCSPKLNEIYRACIYLDANLDKWGYEDLVSELEKTKAIEKVGKDYLMNLATSSNEIVLNVKPMTARLKTLANARRKRDKMQTAIAALESADYETADKEIIALSELSTIGDASPIYSAVDLAHETQAALESMLTGKSLVIKTGLRMFDRFAGGLFPGGMLLIATYPNIGKSQLALLICRKVAETGLPTGILSLEDPPILTGSRLASHVTGLLSSKGMFTGDYSAERVMDMIDTLKDSMPAFRALPIYLTQCGSHTTPEILDSATKLIKERGCKVIALDYAQSIQIGDKAKRHEALSSAVGQLKALCARHSVALICCSQLTANEGGIYREPSPNQLRDTRDLWQMTEQMLMLWKTLVESPTMWRLTKSKIGNVGIGGIVKINTVTGMFDDLGDKSNDQREETRRHYHETKNDYD